jgi:hypothetical protein
VSKKFVHRDCTIEATALFTRFIERHGFTHDVDTNAPVEVMWHIPAQKGLSLPLTLGLQNWDELNLGVEKFWSYFFPFDDVAQRFEQILDKWVAGDARVGITGRRGRILQVRDGGEWETVYKADTLPFFRPRPKEFIFNDPTYSNSTMT